MSLWLSPEELVERTGFRTSKRQCLELARQGVRFTIRHDGFPLVERYQFETLTRGKGKREPDWSTIQGN